MAATTITSSGGVDGSGLVRPLVFNAGNIVLVGYVADAALTGGNIFTVELSDDLGDFTSPTTIHTEAGTAISGTFLVSIPERVIESQFYRIRVVSSSPAITGVDNGFDLTILMTSKLGNTCNQSIIQSHASLDSFIYSFKITIPTAEVLQLNTTPKLLIAAPVAGYAIELLSFTRRIGTYGGAPYATNVSLGAIIDTATDNLQVCADLDATVANWTQSVKTGVGGITNTMYFENKALYAKVVGGNPTAGNSDIVVYGTYRIITL